MKIIIPMAGRGQRFKDAGYEDPKPFIDVLGTPMVKRVVGNMPYGDEDTFVFLVLEEHTERLHKEVENLASKVVVAISGVTEGAAATVLLADCAIDDNDEVLIANSDQWLDWDGNHFVDYCRRRDAFGGVPTFKASGPKWSYADVSEDGYIRSIVEKVPISYDATCGVYWFSKWYQCKHAISQMMKKNIRTNGEFYLAPAYNEMILDGLAPLNYPVPMMLGMGTPEDLDTSKELLALYAKRVA